ncbi:MAG TPA: hypothetical protein VM841_00625, partial [Actinomycetota bacterium]|nr:hypothetical protein [Actinomycetota bacterium]
MKGRFASVVPLQSSLVHRDRLFTYSIPESLDVHVGSLVRIPLGRKRADGVVVALMDRPDVERTVPLIAALGRGLEEATVDLARWTAARYCASLGEALTAALPERVVSEEETSLPPLPHAEAGADWLKEWRGGPALLRALARSGRASFSMQPPPAEDRGPMIASLSAAALSAGRGVLVLLPEVRFRSGVETALKAMFGDALAWLGSNHSNRVRYRGWGALRRGETRIACGGRAAVFAPVPDLGLIVVDDESHVSYKERRQPRFHARTVAAERARRSSATLVAVGVPPSIEVAAAVAARQMTVVAPAATQRRDHPPVQVIDLSESRERLVPAGRTIAAAKQALSRGERVMIMLHRGGDEPARVFERAVRTTGAKAPALLDARSGAAVLRDALRKADLIVSSPVIAKDIPLQHAGLVAICHADAALAQTDFRTAEETFATWWRAARFAARVVIETADPSHPAVRALVRYDPAVLAADEIARRSELGYPPFGGLARIAAPAERASEIAESLEREGATVLGPVERDGGAIIAVKAATR